MGKKAIFDKARHTKRSDYEIWILQQAREK